MALGDNPFDLSGSLLSAFSDSAVSVPLLPSQANLNVPRDIHMRPLQSTPASTVTIVVSKAQEVIDSSETGGKPKEVLEYFAEIGTVNENDEVTWNGHTFRTMSVWPISLGGRQQILSCRAEREIDR